MPRLQRTAQAEEDLIDIWLYIPHDDVGAADHLLDTLDDAFLLLAAQPALGRERPDIAVGLRHFPVRRYLILYREISDGIEIVRVVHGARDMSALLTDS
jgi:toxin ParE1/3/4